MPLSTLNRAKTSGRVDRPARRGSTGPTGPAGHRGSTAPARLHPAGSGPSRPHRWAGSGATDAVSRRVEGADGMTALDIARWQFGIVTVYHFLFVPLTIGLSFLIALMQTVWYRTGNPKYL